MQERESPAAPAAPLSRRRALAGAFGALASGALAACAGPGAAGTSGTAPSARKEVVTIDFNTWYLQTTEPLVPLFEKLEQEQKIRVRMDLNSANRSMEKYTAWYVS
ncbi:MAG TPA: hypothetical protein VH257_13390, partial [Chloroflexota bacterium]|nr:hypothetical protein [Chloroflexota bacterium]